MDFRIAENKGTLARDSQKKNTAISIYWQEKNKRNIPSRPGIASKCTSLSHAKYYLNEDVLAVNKLMANLINEGLMMKMKQLHEEQQIATAEKKKQQQQLRKKLKNKNKNNTNNDENENSAEKNNADDDDNEAPENENQGQSSSNIITDESERQSQYNSVRIINSKLHDALIQKDIWERRVQELELIAKHGMSEKDAADAVAQGYELKNPKKRPKGFYGAARYLPEGIAFHVANERKKADASKNKMMIVKNQQQQQQQQHDEDNDDSFPRRRQRDGDDDQDEDGDDEDSDTGSVDSVDELLAGIVPPSKNQLQQQQAKNLLLTREPRKLFEGFSFSSSSSMIDKNSAFSFLCDFLPMQQSSIDISSDTTEESSTVDPFFIDPAAIPSEKEIQQQILAEKKAQLRAKFLAAKS